MTDVIAYDNVSLMSDDPCDMGALLRAALAEAEVSPVEIARRTGIALSNVSRALGSPDTRPPTARAILKAVGMQLVVTKETKRTER